MTKHILEYEEFINENYSEAFNLKLFLEQYLEFIKTKELFPTIYRGFKIREDYTTLSTNSDNDIYYMNKIGERKSAMFRSKGKDSIHNFWLSNDSTWLEYPKRSESFICTNNYGTSKSFNDAIGFVIPIDYNNTKFGLSPNTDIWSSFDESLHQFEIGVYTKFSVASLDNLIRKGCQLVSDKTNQALDFSNYEEYLNVCKSIDSNLEILKNEGGVYSKLYRDISKSNGLENLTRNIFEPSNTDFMLANGISDYSKKMKNSVKETWFSGDAIIIKLESDNIVYSLDLYKFIANLIEKI